MPSSRQSATAAGFCTSIESGPPSITQPSRRVGEDHAARPRRRFEHADAQAAALGFVRGGQPGDAAADDGEIKSAVVHAEHGSRQ